MTAYGLAMTNRARHCEERSDAAIHCVGMPAMDRHGLRPRDDEVTAYGLAMTNRARHCEERSDAAIQALVRQPWIATAYGLAMTK